MICVAGIIKGNSKHSIINWEVKEKGGLAESVLRCREEAGTSYVFMRMQKHHCRQEVFTNSQRQTREHMQTYMAKKQDYVTELEAVWGVKLGFL